MILKLFAITICYTLIARINNQVCDSEIESYCGDSEKTSILLVSEEDEENPLYLKCILENYGNFYKIYTLKTIPLPVINNALVFHCYIN